MDWNLMLLIIFSPCCSCSNLIVTKNLFLVAITFNAIKQIQHQKGSWEDNCLEQFHPLVLSKVLTPVVWFWWLLRLTFNSNSELSSHYRIRSWTRNIAQNKKSSYKVKVGVSRPLQCFLCWHNSYLQTSTIQDSTKHYLQIFKSIPQ